MGYEEVVWTTGDTITEEKLDKMTANDAGFKDGTAIDNEAITPNHLKKDAWISYTPTGSFVSGHSFTLGNGQLEGYYQRIHNTIHFRVYFKVGSTTSFQAGADGMQFALPVQAKGFAGIYIAALVRVVCFDNNPGIIYDGSGWIVGNGTNVKLFALNAASTYTQQQSFSHSANRPMAWATDDTITIMGSYEAK